MYISSTVRLNYCVLNYVFSTAVSGHFVRNYPSSCDYTEIQTDVQTNVRRLRGYLVNRACATKPCCVKSLPLLS